VLYFFVMDGAVIHKAPLIIQLLQLTCLCMTVT